MILTMKSISFVYYLNEGERAVGKNKAASFDWGELVNYHGYLWNLSTSIHGPWIDLSQHIQAIKQQQLSFVRVGPWRVENGFEQSLTALYNSRYHLLQLLVSSSLWLARRLL